MPAGAATFFASLINCLFVGETRIDRPDGGWYRGLIRLTLDGFQVELRQPEWVVREAEWRDLRGQWNETTEARVLAVSAAQGPEAESLVERLSQLLGFATASEVGVAAWAHELSNPCARRRATSGTTNFLRPVILTGDGAVVRAFVKSTWPGFNRERERRNLAAVFHYLALAEREDTPLELKLAIHSIVLEQLKHSYAVSNGYVFLAGFFHAPGTVTPSRRSRQGFQALLGAMFTAVGMNPALNPVVDLRNEILHSGLSARPFAELMQMEGEILRLIREYLLRLLGYTGEFYTGEVGGVTAVIQ
jgi:hypothetical protein